MTSGARARAFLSRIASVPLDAGAVREFLQRRLRMLATCCFWIAVVTWGLNAALNAIFYPGFAAGRIASPRSLVHATTAISWGLTWLSLCRGPWSERALSWIDLFGTEAMALGFAGMVRLGDAGLRSDMVMSMAVGHLLVLRAAILPSTGRRTAAIGVMAELPIVIMAYLLHAHSRAGAMLPPASAAAALVVWALLAIATTTVISSAIYGLSERVREVARLGQYTLEGKIGEGGMGVVYRARHALLRRPTAIKLLSSAQATEAQLMRFEREVQSTAMLSHPNVVAIYDYGRSASGFFYYAMEYVDGIDLEHLVASDGPQPEGRVRDLLMQAADALEEAHAAGLVHRDVKPSNMILAPPKHRGTESLKIVDFGLVKQMSAEGTNESGIFEVKGTPLYMAPEAITSATCVDARTDLYSLGAVGYFLLTGKPVFEGESVVEICGRHLHVVPEPPSVRLGRAVSPLLEQAILDCLAKSPAQRPKSAAELLEILRACRDCGSFSLEEAGRWWIERAPAIRDRVRHDQDGSASANWRLRVDPKGRS